MSLTSLCIEKIAESIDQAPPMIQEMIINDTSENIKAKALKQTVKELNCILPSMVSSISKSIILARSTFNDNPNFYEIYVTVPPEIVALAINIAERNVYEMDKKFRILTNVSANRYRFYTSETETESDMEDFERESTDTD